uniref:Protein FAM229B n=1 Tax=Felis catus TaxID=9685 RepID=A0ABI7VX92_FELCA
MPFRFGTQPRKFPVEGGDSSVGLESGLSSSAACNGKEMSPTRFLMAWKLLEHRFKPNKATPKVPWKSLPDSN